MANKTQTITIDSILGGHSAYANFANTDQYRNSVGIDPSFLEYYDTFSGFICPTNIEAFSTSSSSEITDTPLWIIPQPKSSNVYVYGSSGSTYTGSIPLANVANSRGNGASYYDNYVYFASNTTIARYGPLDGSPSMTADYWVTTLGKTQLTDTTYPTASVGTIKMPNHVMLRHSDGALYIADVVGNQGVLHKIKTTKATVEGDTDSGSTYNIIDFPYGMYVTAMASYGDKIVVALYEGSGGTTQQSRAKIAIWDPTNTTTYDTITSDEFPDVLITALLNTNGVIYVFSTNKIGNDTDTNGVRIMRMVSPYSFEQIAYNGNTIAPLPGAVDGSVNRIIWGGKCVTPGESVVYAIGTPESPLNNAIYCPLRSMASSSLYPVTALKFGNQYNLALSGSAPILGWGNGTTGTGVNGLDKGGGQTNDAGAQMWQSRAFLIGSKFKITKVAIPVQSEVTSAERNIAIYIIVDDNSVGGNTYTLTPINSVTHVSGTYRQIRRGDQNGGDITGEHLFYLKLVWTGTQIANYKVALPITIEYEILSD